MEFGCATSRTSQTSPPKISKAAIDQRVGYRNIVHPLLPVGIFSDFFFPEAMRVQRFTRQRDKLDTRCRFEKTPLPAPAIHLLHQVPAAC